ncbi:hypothetical protein evm_003826 [Chilo suppressalis]|nr:hypothetical protein evm_003826 [Chilo suppressalis]
MIIELQQQWLCGPTDGDGGMNDERLKVPFQTPSVVTSAFNRAVQICQSPARAARLPSSRFYDTPGTHFYYATKCQTQKQLTGVSHGNCYKSPELSINIDRQVAEKTDHCRCFFRVKERRVVGSIDHENEDFLTFLYHHHHHQPINLPTAGPQAFLMDGIGRLGHDPPRGPSADWSVLTAADAAGTNDLTCLPKHGRARDSKFLVSHPMTDHRESCLTSTIAAEPVNHLRHRALNFSV